MTSKDINNTPTGFYYDVQLNNPMLMVTLHANTKKSTEGPKYSIPWPGDKEEDAAGDYPYGKEPICRSVISEDFQISISNNVSDFGGDPLGGLWNQVVKPYSSYLADTEVAGDIDFITGKLSEMATNWQNSEQAKVSSGEKEESLTTKLSRITGETAKWVHEMFQSDGKGGISKAAAIASRTLIVQGTQFSYYAGTGTDLGTLTMKFVVFSGYDNQGKYHTVAEQLEELEWYVGGEYKPCSKAAAEGDGASDSMPEFISKFASWQLAPGGYIAGIKNINQVQYGTLKLRVGPFYAIENLIISGAQYNYSKTLCKVPKTGDDTTLDPLFCEVTLNLKPVTKFSADAVFSFANGKRSEKYRKTVLNDMKSSLQTLKSKTSDPTKIQTI